MIAERFGRNGMNLVSVSAPRTIPARCATVGDLMPVSAIGAIPGVRTKRLSAGSVTRAAVAVGTVPVPGGTGFVHGCIDDSSVWQIESPQLPA